MCCVANICLFFSVFFFYVSFFCVYKLRIIKGDFFNSQEGPHAISVADTGMRTTSSLEANNGVMNNCVVNRGNFFTFVHDKSFCLQCGSKHIVSPVVLLSLHEMNIRYN